MPRSREHHFTLPKFHADHNRNLSLLYALRVTRDLLNKFTLFFLPIFLYELGSETSILAFLDVSEFQLGMLTMGFYYIVNGFVSAATNIWGGQIIAKIGYQKSFILTNILYLLQFVGLFYLSSNPLLSLLVLCAFIRGLSSPFFWGSYLTILSKNAKRAHMGQDVGLLRLLLQLVAVVAPAISGFITYMLGMEFLFLMGIAITLIAIIIILLMEEDGVRYNISWKEFFSWLGERRYERLAVSIGGKYFYDAAVFIWPLYVFLILGTIDKVGYLYTVSLFIAMLVTYFMSIYIDNSKDKKPFYLSGGILSAVWLARTQIVTVWGIVISDVIDRLAANVHGLFFDTAVIKRGKGRKAFSYFMYRDILLNVAAVIFWVLFSIFFYFFDGNWTIMFVLASIGVMATLLVRESKEDMAEV